MATPIIRLLKRHAVVSDYRDISTYRSELMGWSIVWIMMLHFTFTQLKPLGFVAQYGIAGVDIFLFVSGYGLFFALEKSVSLRSYYKRRLLRIFPAYYIIGIFYSFFLFYDGITDYLFRFTTLGFWFDGLYCDWYIPSIVLLYLLSPYVKKLFYMKGSAIILSAIVVVIYLVAYLLVDRELIYEKEPHFFLLYRIPAFLFGMACAYWLKTKAPIRYFYIIMFIGIPFFVVLFPQHHDIYNYKYLSLAFLLPVFVYGLILLCRITKPLNGIMARVGNASLEIFLIQGIFFYAIVHHLVTIPAPWHDAITLGLMLLCTLLGIISHHLIDKCLPKR